MPLCTIRLHRLGASSLTIQDGCLTLAFTSLGMNVRK
jgi:hypothetical protein